MAGDGRGWQGTAGRTPEEPWVAGASKTDSGGAVVSRCPAGHRFNSSPRHRSAKRAGVGGEKDIQTNVVSGGGHRFTAPDGPECADIRNPRLKTFSHSDSF